MRKHILSTLLLLFIQFVAFSQSSIFDWAKRMGGTGADQAYQVATDATGNVYSTGYFSGTANFNPGGTANLTSAGSDDVFVSKLDPSGNFLWAIKLGGTLGDIGHSIAVDAAGNVYVAGSFRGTANFNPGGTYNLTSAGQEDIFIAKYTTAGVFVWAKRMGSTLPDIAYALTLDASANVYTTGYFFGTVNFNPGGTFNLISNSSSADIFVSKLDAAGSFVWAKNMGGAMQEVAYGIAVDASLNVYTTGWFEDVADFDPSGVNYDLTCVGTTNIFISKLNSLGNFVWAKRMGTSTGEGAGVAVDASYNVYASGRFGGTADFDAISLTSAGGNDAFVTKLDASGAFLWADQMGGTLGDASYGLSLDASGNIISTGYFYGVADFNPGAPTNNITSLGAADAFISKLSNAGNFIWVKQMGGTGFETGNCVVVNSAGFIHTAGSFETTSNFDPAGTFNLTSSGSSDIFIQKLKPCTNTFKTINVAACLTYSLNAQTYTTTGTYTQTLTNAAGCDSTLTINLRISNVTASISSQTNVNCFAGNTGAATVLPAGGILPYTYFWTSGAGTAATATGLTAMNYTCTINDSIGCWQTQVVVITQPASALSLSTTFTDASCTNDGTANVLASGGTSPYTYLWSNSDITPGTSGLVAGPYSVTVTDFKGCTSVGNVVITNSILPRTPDICLITVDGTSTNNIIYWDKTGYTNADSFIVYREVSTAIYKRIAAIVADSLSEFIDTSRSVGPANGDPNVGSYRYKLQVRDICGNYSALSPYHNTIYIIDAGLGQFIWSIPYSIEGGANPVANYVLLCDTANVDVWGPVATVAGTQVTATDPGFVNHSTIANWRVKTLWSITCTPTRATINTSRSNIKHGSLITAIGNEAQLANSILIYPNPSNDHVTIEFTNLIQNGKIRIYNLIGQEVYSTDISAGANTITKQQLDVSSFARGVYQVTVESGNTRTFKKLILN